MTPVTPRGTYFMVLRSPGSWISARPRSSASAPAA
jgi:hypothetical protein